MNKKGVILLLGIFVISSLIVVFNSYNVSNPMITEDNPDVTDSKTYDAETFPEASNDILSSFFINEGFYSGLVLDPDGHSWYNISLNFDESIIINLYFSNSSPGGDLNLELWNFTDVLDVSYSNTDNESITYLIKNPGYYYIHAFNQSDFYDSYNLEIEIDDRFEPNNDIASAGDIGMAYHSSLKSRDHDWYKIWFNLGDEFTIDLLFASTTFNLELELRNDSILLKESYSSTSNEHITWIAEYSGYHYIHIYEYNDLGNNIDYDLDIYPRGDDPFEENDFISESEEIWFNYHPNLFCQDNDWFNFSVIDGEQFTVEIYFDHSSGDLELELYNSTYDKIFESISTDDDEYISWIAEYSGYYYINIYNYTTDTNNYDLNIYTSSFGEDIHEENDNVDEASDISPGYHPGLFCQDEDWFKFWIYNGEQVEVKIYFQNSSGNLDMKLYKYEKLIPLLIELDNSNSFDDNEIIFRTANYTGWHYIQIINNGFINSYELEINILFDKYERHNGFDNNNNFGSAYELYKGYHRDIMSRDEDYYKIKLNASEQITVEIYFIHIYGDLNLKVFDYNFISVDTSNSGGDIETITFTADETNFYYIQVIYSGVETYYDMKIGKEENIFQEDFEGGLSPKWSGFGGNNYWHVRDPSPSNPTHSIWCGNEITGTYNKKIDDKDIIYRDSIVLTDLDLRDYCYVELSMDYKFSTGTSSIDKTGFSVRVLGDEFYLDPKYTDNVFELGENYVSSMGWSTFTYDLSFFSGYEHVEIIFYFYADDMDNNYEGIMVDNIGIIGIKDEVFIGKTLDIAKGDELYYYISYIDEQAWSKEIFGKDIPRFAGMIKLEIFGIYDRGEYWDVIARFWEPWDDFDELKNTEEISYSVYKNPLNMKDGADFFLPSNNLMNYIDRGDNFDWYQNYNIEHWYEPMWNEYRIEYCFDNFSVHLTYSSNGILLGMSIHKNYGNGGRIFEMWRDDNKDHSPDDEEEERDAIPGYDITIVITIIAAMSIITAIRVKKLRKK